MSNKNLYIAGGIAVLALVLFLASKQGGSSPLLPKIEDGNKAATSSPTTKTPAAQKTASGAKAAPTVQKTSATGKAVSKFPDIEFIDKRMDFPLTDFPNVKVTIEKVAFGRGDAAMSTGCSGIPNVNFSTYLYPESGICLSTEKIDGSPRGIVAFHLLIENRGNIGFGGNSDTLKLHYLRSGSDGQAGHRFAHPILGLSNYYINGYSSKKVVLSYLVPEDQLVFDLVSGHNPLLLEATSFNVYDYSTNGLQVDFGSKNLKIIK